MADTYLKRNGSNKIAKVILMRIKIGEDFCRTIRLLLCSLGTNTVFGRAAVEWEYIFLPSFAITPKLLRSNKLELLSAASPESHPPNKTPENLFFAICILILVYFLKQGRQQYVAIQYTEVLDRSTS